MCGHLGERNLGDEAEVARSRSRLVGDETGDVVGWMQGDLLLPEAQCGAPFTESHDLHPEHPGIELAGAGDVG